MHTIQDNNCTDLEDIIFETNGNKEVNTGILVHITELSPVNFTLLYIKHSGNGLCILQQRLFLNLIHGTCLTGCPVFS